MPYPDQNSSDHAVCFCRYRCGASAVDEIKIQVVERTSFHIVLVVITIARTTGQLQIWIPV